MTRPLHALKIPTTVQAILTARIDRLPAGQKDLLETLAVIGKDFRLGLVSKVVARPHEELERTLERLQIGEFIYEQPAAGDIEYRFKHQLTREAAYNSVLIERRKALHERVAHAIEELNANTLGDHIDDLAHHLWEAGTAADLSKTINSLRMASHRAVLKGAYETSVSHLRNALELLQKLPPSASRESQELALQRALGGTLMVTKGYAAADVNTAFQRARTLSQVGGDASKQVSVLGGLWAASFVGGKHRAAREIAGQALEVAQNQDDPTLLLRAHMMLGLSCLYQGELQLARIHLQRCRELPDQGKYSPHSEDPRVMSRSWLGVALLRLGYPDQGLKTAQDALSFARQLPLPRFRNEVYAMNYVATLHMERHEWSGARDVAEKMAEISIAQGLTQWSIASNILIGVAIAEQGELAQGAARLSQALAGWRETGASTSTPVFMGKLGTFYGRLGRTTEGLSLLDDALALSLETGELLDTAELHRRKGEIILNQMSGSSVGEGTEGCLLEAIKIARVQAGKYYELRAAIDLGHLWKKLGRSRQARAMLAEIYGWFTEGFDTADLKDAKELLDELHG